MRQKTSIFTLKGRRHLEAYSIRARTGDNIMVGHFRQILISAKSVCYEKSPILEFDLYWLLSSE